MPVILPFEVLKLNPEGSAGVILTLVIGPPVFTGDQVGEIAVLIINERVLGEYEMLGGVGFTVMLIEAVVGEHVPPLAVIV